MFSQKSSLWAIAFSAIVLVNPLISCSAPLSTQASRPSTDMKSMGQGAHGTNMNGRNMKGTNHSMSMNLGLVDPEFDLRFIDSMTPHHEGAVSMANTARQSKRPEIQKFAAQIIRSQSAEIAEMTRWRKSWYPQVGSALMVWSPEKNKTVAMSPQQKQDMSMKQSLGAADANFDLRFLNAMIPHHEGAVTMAIAAQKSKRPEVQKLAASIIASQQAEIQQMNQWRKAWYSQ
jgi:uncharacterized protein (DUF305 family)